MTFLGTGVGGCVLVIGSLTFPGTGVLVVLVGHGGLGFSSRVSKQNFVYILRSIGFYIFCFS